MFHRLVGLHEWKKIQTLRALISDVAASRSFSAPPSDVTMIEDAFRVAHAADPDAWLYLPDGANEEKGRTKPDAFHNPAARLVSDGVPVKGVGLEGHLFIGTDN